MALSRASMRLVALQIVLAVAVGVGLWLAYPGWRLGLVTERVRKEYPDVPQISANDLAQLLASNKGGKPILLDVRSPEEYAVSHLIEAHRLTPGVELNPDDLPDEQGHPVVVYCSTGERSAAYARRVQRAGYRRVSILEGGIVRWANEGHPMTDGRGLVTRAHPGGVENAALLKGPHRATVPAAP